MRQDMQPIGYNLKHDELVIFTNPTTVIKRNEAIYKKFCLAIANQDWVYVHGLIAVHNQERTKIQKNSDISIHNDEVMFQDRPINYLIALAYLHSVHNDQEPEFLIKLSHVMQEIKQFLETPISDEKFKGIEEVSTQQDYDNLGEILSSLDMGEDLEVENGNDSWGSWFDEDYPAEGVVFNDEQSLNSQETNMDGGSFKDELPNSIEPGLQNDLQTLRDEFHRNRIEELKKQQGG